MQLPISLKISLPVVTVFAGIEQWYAYIRLYHYYNSCCLGGGVIYSSLKIENTLHAQCNDANGIACKLNIG